jgi:hypothetical protein
MARYYIIYKTEKDHTRVKDSFMEALDEREARANFKEDFPNGEIFTLRKGRPFTSHEVSKKQKELKFR